MIGILSTTGMLSYSIWKAKPRSNLYDHLPTLLIHGTLYNTQREKHLKYFMIPIVINIMRGITFGGLQPSGIAQVTLLAACEIVMILAVYGIKPYARETSMNLWHFIFSIVRLLTILLMMAFVPSINATDAVKSWTGWVILGIHAVILLFGFVLKALQTLLELVVRGYSTDEEAARGGFAKVCAASPRTRPPPGPRIRTFHNSGEGGYLGVHANQRVRFLASASCLAESGTRNRPIAHPRSRRRPSTWLNVNTRLLLCHPIIRIPALIPLLYY